jgi:acyl dehydratase
MTMEKIRTFADATGDHQWIHVDEERATRESPFKKAIAHGYLTLSLTAGSFFEVVDMVGFELVVNYGTNKVRFPSALPLGARFRTSFTLGQVKDVGEGWTEAIFHATVEVEGQAKPACVAESVFRVKARR